MYNFIHSQLFLLTFTIGVYVVSLWIYRKTKLMLLHPLLTSLLVIIAGIKTADIPYQEYAEATKIIDFMLGISVVALGYLLYEQMTHMKGNITAMLTAILVGSVVGIVSVILIAKALGADPRIVASLEPKSITTPIAVTVCAHSGGIPALTAIVVILVGVFGAVIGPFILKKLGIESKLARGLALGSAAHAVGTARAMELGAVEGAISGLAIGLMGAITAVMVPVIEAIMRFFG
jgi:predicted murein hydrolase (TIGR00659 family)